MAFVRGSIVRITLNNFMTHSSCEINPGPRLNLLIGANGSGKSSILCAIALGLGGEPKDLGRSNQVSAYIKNGEESAWIEIEITNGKDPKRNAVVKRTIKHGVKENSRGLSTWAWNGEKKSQQNILDKLQDFNINVGNLCQVLPQDRVGDFSKFDSVTLLDETIRATLTERFVEMKENIYSMTDTLHRDSTILNKKKIELLKVQKNNERLEGRVAQLQQRKGVEEKINILEKLRPWLNYQQKESMLHLQIKNKKKLEVDLKSVQKKSKQRENEAKSSSLKRNQLRTQFREKRQKFDLKKKHSFQWVHNVHSNNGRAEEFFENLGNLATEKDSIEQNIANAEAKVHSITEALNDFPDLDEMKETLKSLTKQMQPIETELIDVLQEIRKNQSNKKWLANEVKGLEKALAQKRNIEAQKSRFISSTCSEDMSKAYETVSKMNNSGRFKQKVFGPVCLELKIDNSLCAKYIESCLPLSLLTSYVTQNSKDRDLLMRSGKINACNVQINKNKSNMQLYKCTKLSDLPGSRKLRELGILGFGYEFIECDEVVLEAIVRVTKLKSVLFASEKFERALEKSDPAKIYSLIQNIVGESFQIWTPSTIHQATVSKYSNQQLISTNSTQLYGKGFGSRSLLYKCATNDRSYGVDQDEEDQICSKLEEKRSELKELSDADKSLGEHHRQLRSDKDKIGVERQRQRNEITAFHKLETNLKRATLSYEKALQGREKDFSAEERKIENNITKYFSNNSNILSQSVKDISGLVSLTTSLTESALDFGFVAYKAEAFKEEILRWKRDVDLLKRKIATEKQAIMQLESKNKLRREKLDEEIPLETYGEKFKETKIRDIETLDTELDKLEAELSTMISDPSLLLEFENGRKTIAKLKPEVKDLHEKINTMTDDLNEKREGFEKAVKQKVSIINKKYSEMFGTINNAGYKCEGRVEFIKNAPSKAHSNRATRNDFSYSSSNMGDNSPSPEDQLNYGVGIFVRFRESQKLELLNSAVQSGGERSLSTFLYLLSLQECSAAPFRVVDEINQGMDAQKERLAFMCLVENSCREGLPQYFLITPKLLTGLNFPPDLKVNFVQNGVAAINQSHCSTRSFINAFRKTSLSKENKRRKTDDSLPTEDEDFDSGRENIPVSTRRRNEADKLPGKPKAATKVVKKEKSRIKMEKVKKEMSKRRKVSAN